MKIKFSKYQALQNDFIVFEKESYKLAKNQLPSFVKAICRRRSGVGADGVLYLGKSAKSDYKIDVFNADGSWAEKSGNGLRIAGLHLYQSNNQKKNYVFEMGGRLNQVRFVSGHKSAGLLSTELGIPEFQANAVPIKVKSKFMINRPLKVGDTSFPVTCLSLGNPHTVLFVEDFNFDWKGLGAKIEKHRLFPKGTNVEFVKIVSRKKLKLTEWERGVGATGSSGTGAAAAVAAAVVLGAADRKCLVEFESGSLSIHWRKSDNIIELTGPAAFVCEGFYQYQ